jgi:hypothetical protein
MIMAWPAHRGHLRHQPVTDIAYVMLHPRLRTAER